MTATRRLLTALVIIGAGLTGCFNERDENTNEGTDTSPGETAVEVNLSDDGIAMPEEIPAGPVLFEVTNTGTSEHGLAIDGVDESIDSLGSDQMETLRTQLEPGTYVVFSPVEGDREAGLELELTVTEGEGGGGDNLSDEGVGPSEEQDEVDEGDGG
jgi:hypothetical protein